MKKNRMMRLASVLLVCVLLTTSVISGTFAKYVTTDAQQDEARVAKWGVVASIKGNLFGATYVGSTDNSITSYGKYDGTVSSADSTELVVAPGTKNINALTLSTAGTPEVSTKVTFDYAEDDDGNDYANCEIYLAKDYTYGVMIPYSGDKTTETYDDDKYYVLNDKGEYVPATENDVNKTWFELQDEVKLTENYYPIDWYINGTKQNATMRIGTLYDHVAATFNNANTFAPNSFVAKEITIGWEWEFGAAWDDQKGTNDEIITNPRDYYDTVLGNMMAYFNVDDEAVAASDYKVVAKTATGDGNFVNVSYETVNVKEGSANTMQIVKVNDDVVACLTVAFNGRITVEQVD